MRTVVKCLNNKQFGHAVQDNSMGMTGTCQMFNSLDLLPLSSSNCQRSAKTVDDAMIKVNGADMAQLKQQKIGDNAVCGLTGERRGDAAIAVDTRYNSVRFGDGRKMERKWAECNPGSRHQYTGGRNEHQN